MTHIIWVICTKHIVDFFDNEYFKTWTNMTDRLPLLSRVKDKQDAETSKYFFFTRRIFKR